MKKTVFFFCIVSAIINLRGQTTPWCEVRTDKYTVLDSADIKVAYRLKSVKDTIKNEPAEDIQTLLIGKNYSKYYSEYYLEYNTNTTKLILKGAEAVPRFTKEGSYGYEIFKNKKESEMIVTDLGTCIRGNYYYKEAIPDFSWRIENEYCQILSYSCQKAVGAFRGRTYEAWFSTEIPINNGPWKFGGLPGLILKIADSQKHYQFECIGLENLEKKEEIKEYDLEYKKVKREDIAKLYKRYHKDWVAYNVSLGETVRFMNPNTRKWEDRKNAKEELPYNPIEGE